MLVEEEDCPLVASGECEDGRGRRRDVHILCVAFLLVFLAYGAAQNLESSVNSEAGLGTTSLGVLYVSFMVFSFFASFVVRFLGSKNALLLGTTGYWLFIAANLIPSWYTMIPASLYMGFAASIVWVAQPPFLLRSLMAEFTKYIVTPSLGLSGVGATMALYGATDAIFSLAAGRLTSGLKSITLIVSGGVFAQAIVFFWIFLKYSGTSGDGVGVLYPFVMAALLGIGDGVLNTQLNALLGMLFKHDTEGAFAQLKVWQSAAIALVFFLSPNISLQAMVLIMIAGLCVSYASFLLLTLMVEKAFSSRTYSVM